MKTLKEMSLREFTELVNAPAKTYFLICDPSRMSDGYISGFIVSTGVITSLLYNFREHTRLARDIEKWYRGSTRNYDADYKIIAEEEFLKLKTLALL